MKKLMIMLGAVAMSFGLFAADATPFSISFESAEEAAGGYGVDTANMKFTPTADWTWDGDPLTMKEYADGEGYTYGEGAQARRTFLDEGDNKNYLTLETGKKELTRTAGKTYLDQTVKFTGFEEFQTNLVDGAKIAVWMSGIETDDEAGIEGETNLYVTVGKVDTEGNTIEQVALKIKENCDLDAWYRLTIKSIGNIFGDSQEVPARAGFVIYVNGKRVVSLDDAAKSIVLSGELTTQAASLMASGALFPAVVAEDEGVTDKFASVGYQGIGSIDDITLDNDGPEFCQAVEVTIDPVTGAIIKKVLDGEGNEVTAKSEGVYDIAPGNFQIVWVNDEGYITFEKTINHTTDDSQPIDDSEALENDIKEVVAVVDGELEFATLAEALDEVEGSTEYRDVEIKKDCEYVTELGKYSFNEGAVIEIDGIAWDVDAGEGVVTNTLGTVPGKKITVTNGKLALAGMILAGDDKNVATITADDVELVGDLDVGMLGDSGLLGAALTITEDGALDAGEFQIKLYSAGAVYYADEGALITDEAIVSAETGKVVAYNAGVYSLVPEMVPVVEIVGGKQYGSLADALADAKDGDELKLLADIELTAPTEITKEITLDLNKKEITVADGTYGYAAILVTASGATIKNGKVTSAATAEVASCFIDFAEANGTLKDLVVNSTNFKWGIGGDLGEEGDWTTDYDTYTVAFENVKATGSTSVFQAEGVILTLDKNCSATQVGEHAQDWRNCAIHAGFNAKIVIAGGEYTGKHAICKMSSPAKIYINGGKFTIDVSMYEISGGYKDGGDDVFEIKAGNFNVNTIDTKYLVNDVDAGYERAWVTGDYDGYYKPGAKAITYNITYTFEGVEDGDVDSIVNDNPKTFTVESETITFADATCEGYEFKGFAPASITKGTIGDQEIVGTFEKAADDPVVPPEQGEIKPNASTGGYEVTPAEGVTEIDVSNLGDKGTYVSIPPQVNTVKGVPAEKIKVLVPTGTPGSSYDITAAFTKTGDAATGVKLELNEEATVKIDEETIAVKPTIGENVEASEVDITAGEIAVKAIPGLTYELVRSTKLGDAKTEQIADTAKATATKVELTDKITGEKPPAAFYQIKVEAK